MASCILCEKQSNRAVRRVKLRGKYNPTTVYRQKPNLQWVRLHSSGKRVKACAKCIKRLSKTA